MDERRTWTINELLRAYCFEDEQFIAQNLRQTLYSALRRDPDMLVMLAGEADGGNALAARLLGLLPQSSAIQ